MIQSRGWYEWNWNPVVGCKHGCEYCYAREYSKAWIADYEQPQFFADVLDEPRKLRKPAVIFVCAYADLFGDWVSDEWILSILEVIRETLHTYVLLTKNPKRYKEFTYSENVHLGVTITKREDMWRADEISAFAEKKFCSIEPILGDFTGVDLSMFDNIVAGYLIKHRVTYKEKQWMKSISHHNLYKIIR